MINNIILVGKLLSQPIKSTSNNDGEQKWYELLMHVRKPFKNAMTKEENDIIVVKIWEKQIHHLKNILLKDMMIGIRGHIKNKAVDEKELEVIAENIVFFNH